MDAPPPLLATHLGRFELVQRIAVGGMAEVFLAIERSRSGIERRVVIKQILPQHDSDESFEKAFLREAQIAARIQHPNVVQIYELGEAKGKAFIAMEYVPGAPLLEVLNTLKKGGKTLTVGAGLHLIMQACSGAQAAHELKDREGNPTNLVHRDLSPHNLMVTQQGHLKILDFGIAKVSDGMDHTKTGMLKGKFPYMSPEQIEAKPLDRRSDIFSLGAVLWEVLTGDRLFQRSNEVATLNAILNKPIPELAREGVPHALNAVIQTALAKDPHDRFATAQEMHDALAQVCRDHHIDASPQETARCLQLGMGPLLDERERVLDEVEKSLQKRPTPDRRRPIALTAGVFVLVAALLGGVWAAGAWLGRPLGPPIEIALPPTVDARLLQQDLEPLRDYLQQTTRRPIVWRVTESYDEVAELVASGEVPYGSFPPYLYIKTATPEFSLLATKVYEESSGTDAILLVPEGAPIDVLADLKGTTICYSDPSSTTGYLLPRAALRKAGLDPDTDLTPRVSGNHMQALRDLEEGRCMVAGTYMGALLAAEDAGVKTTNTRVLSVTGRVPHESFVAGPGADAQLTQQLAEALLAFDPMESAGVERLGEVERLSGFARPNEDALMPLREAAALEP